MIVDTSALVAIIKAEDDASFYARALEAEPDCRISAVNWMEAGIVLDRQEGGIAGREFDVLVARAGLQVEPVTPEQAALARQAYLVYGKGRHKAGLNFADCFAYALAKSRREALLFKGNDFGHTDVMVWAPEASR